MGDLGIKKIKWNRTGEIVPNLSVPDQKLVLKPDQEVGFCVSEFFPGTTESHLAQGIVWILQDESRTVILKQTIRQDYKKNYYLSLPARLCGTKWYYLEASLSGTRDMVNNTGLKVRGYCVPKITGSAWQKTEDGPDVRTSYVFSYGHIIYLNLKTEGLNGYKNLKISIYRQVKGGGGLNDDQHIRDIIVPDPVTDGELTLKISNTSTWWAEVLKKKNSTGNPNGIELFYVQVYCKGTDGVYRIVDDKGKNKVHATYLRVKNTLVSQHPSPPTNVTKTTVHKPEYNESRPEPCTFKKIVLYENGEPTTIFSEEKLLKLRTDKDTFYNLRNIYYDFDKYNLRTDSLPTLKEVSLFLLETPYLPVEIGAHTDIRGTDTYNQALSQKRAQSVVDYLVSQGLAKDRITARGYGSSQLVYKGTDISEEQHQANRRTTLKFDVYGNNAREIVVEVLAPTYNTPKEMKIKVENRDTIQCRKDHNKHSRVKKIKEISNLHTGKESTQDTDLINYPVYSPLNADFPRNYAGPLLRYLTPGKDFANHFYFYINSCAYYSSKNQPTIHLKVYPDLVWIGHFQYNYYVIKDDQSKGEKKDYFFHNKKVTLTHGITEVVEELSERLNKFLFNIIPKSWLSDNVLINYIKSIADDYDYGFHSVHNRQPEKPGEDLILTGTNTNFIKDTSYTRLAGAYVIYKLVMLQIAIDLLLIYLTRGRNLSGKVARLAKRINRAKQFMEDNNIELIAPSIAVNAGMYYRTQKDLRMALVYELNIKAEPLVEVRYKQEFDLINDFLNSGGKKGNQTVANMLKKAGVTTLKGTFDVTGDISFEDTIQMNMLTNTYTLGEKMKNLYALGKFERVAKDAINAEVSIDGKLNKEFDFLKIRMDIEGKVDFYMKGGAGLKINYGMSPEKGPFMEYTLVFSGIKGTYTGDIKAKTPGRFFNFDYSPNDGKPIPFTLLEAKNYTLFKIYLFNPNP